MRLLYVLLVLTLIGCDTDRSEIEKLENELEEFRNKSDTLNNEIINIENNASISEDEDSDKDEKLDQSKIRGIKISGLTFEIYPHHLKTRHGGIRHTGWFYAKEECEKLGNNWRLPTIEELRLMYEHRNEIGEYDGIGIWSSTESQSGIVISKSFDDGFEKEHFTNDICCVRPIRDL